VFLLIFSFFKVEAKYQHKVLFWGILGALIMRAIFIAAGISLLHAFEWMIYVFGGFLVFTGIKMAVKQDGDMHLDDNPVLKLVRKMFPVTKEYVGGQFTVVREGKRWLTPMAVVLILIEATDVVFAVDSIPAVLAITTDPFIVYSSNVFAILGLRALYFALSGVMTMFHHLHYGLAVILSYVGVKMIVSHWYKIPTGVSLLVILGVLVISIITSLMWPEKKKSA
jgi:tellurite resistance protein TerC